MGPTGRHRFPRKSAPGLRARRSACRDRWATLWSPASSISCSRCWKSTAPSSSSFSPMAATPRSAVASAGVTVMAAFPKERRWLTRDAALLIHGRRMFKDLHLEGPLGSCRRVLEEMIADIDHGLRLEERGFAELIDGADVDAEEIARRAYGGWYLSAEEALSRGLVAGLV